MYHQRHTEKAIMVTLTPNRIKDSKKNWDNSNQNFYKNTSNFWWKTLRKTFETGKTSYVHELTN